MTLTEENALLRSGNRYSGPIVIGCPLVAELVARQYGWRKWTSVNKMVDITHKARNMVALVCKNANRKVVEKATEMGWRLIFD